MHEKPDIQEILDHYPQTVIRKLVDYTKQLEKRLSWFRTAMHTQSPSLPADTWSDEKLDRAIEQEGKSNHAEREW